MSVNTILTSYFQRRGYLMQKDPKLSSIVSILSTENIMSISDTVNKVLNNYLIFLLTFDDVQRSKFAYLNFLIYRYLNKHNFEVPKQFVEQCFSQRQSDSLLDQYLIEELRVFVKSTELQEFAPIFSFFLSTCDDQQFDDRHEHRKIKIEPDDSLKIKCHHIDFAASRVICADVGQKSIISAGLSNGTILIWDDVIGDQFTINAHKSAIFGAKFVHRDKYLLSVSDDSSIKLWNMESDSDQQPFFEYKGHCAPVYCSDIDSIHQYFATGSADNKCCLFCFEKTQPVRSLAYHSEPVQCVKFAQSLVPNRDGVIATFAADKKVCLWSKEDVQPVRVYNNMSHYPSLIAYHPTAHILITGTTDSKLSFIDVRNDKCLQLLDLDACIPYSIEFDGAQPGCSQFYVGGLTGNAADSTLNRLSIDFSNSDKPFSCSAKIILPTNTNCCHVIRCSDLQTNVPVVVVT